jgi:hypothetical protein
MALPLCDGDPIVNTLREVFHANIIRVPEERFAPLTVLAADGSAVSFRGGLRNLIKGDSPAFPDPADSLMTTISGQKTRSMDLSLGLQILDGFLKGLGAGSAGIDTKFKTVQKVTYSFANVVRKWVDDGAVGRLLIDRVIDKQNPAAAIFFGSGQYAFLVLDSVITSSEFTIAVDKTSSGSFSFDLPGIQNIIGKSSTAVSVSTATGYELTFTGQKQLAFAFSCVQFRLDPAGTIQAMFPDDQAREPAGFMAFSGSEHEFRHNPGHVLLSRKPALVDVTRVSDGSAIAGGALTPHMQEIASESSP